MKEGAKVEEVVKQQTENGKVRVSLELEHMGMAGRYCKGFPPKSGAVK